MHLVLCFLRLSYACSLCWTSCSRPSLCNDRCRFWFGHCSALPVETPQAHFLDEVLGITTVFMVQTVQTVWRCRCCSSSSRTLTSLRVALRQIPVVLVRFHSCRSLGGRCPSCALQHPSWRTGFLLMVQTVRRTIEIPQLPLFVQFLDKLSRPSLCNDRCRSWSRQCAALGQDW